MKIRLLMILGLMFWGWLRPEPVLAVAACLPAECEGHRVLDVPIGCDESTGGTYCKTVYNTDTVVNCDSDCTYPVLDWGPDNQGNPVLLRKCTADAHPLNNCPSELTTVGPGTCCTGEGGGGGGGCGATAPVIGANGVDWDQMKLTWTKGNGGVSQMVMAAPWTTEGYEAIEGNCGGKSPTTDSRCTFRETGLPTALQTYNLDGNDYTVGETYIFKVVTVADPYSCSRSDMKISTYTATCAAGVPTGLAADWNDPNYPTRLVLTWTPGGGTDSDSQTVMASTSQTALNNDCVVASQCDINASVGKNTSVYRPLKSVFDSGAVYYFKVINVADPTSCNVDSETLTTISSCTLTPASAILDIGGTEPFSMAISGTIDRVNFSSDDTDVVRVIPGFRTAPAYTTTATGQNVALELTTKVWGKVILEGEQVCSDDSDVTVLPASVDAWWQAVGGDVHADSGNIVSDIPATCIGSCSPYLIAEATNGITGALSRSGIISSGAGGLTEDGKNWNLITTYDGIKTGYEYFERILESNPASASFSWDGSEPTVSGVFLGSGVTVTTGLDWTIPSGVKAVILAPNNLTINQNITVANGGFLAIISSGNIIIANAVTSVQGIYVADGRIITCVSGACSSALNAAGSFTGWEGFSLRRALTGSGNNTAPGEKFTYRGDLMVNAYQYLLRPRINWQEVAP